MVLQSYRFHKGGNGAVIGSRGNAGGIGTATIKGRDSKCSDVGDSHVVRG